MAKLQSVRRPHHNLPDEMPRYRNVFDAVAEVGATYGYGEIATPTFEVTEGFLFLYQVEIIAMGVGNIGVEVFALPVVLAQILCLHNVLRPKGKVRPLLL